MLSDLVSVKCWGVLSCYFLHVLWTPSTRWQCFKSFAVFCSLGHMTEPSVICDSPLSIRCFRFMTFIFERSCFFGPLCEIFTRHNSEHKGEHGYRIQCCGPIKLNYAIKVVNIHIGFWLAEHTTLQFISDFTEDLSGFINIRFGTFLIWIPHWKPKETSLRE